MKPETISAKEFIDEQVKIAKKRGSKYRNIKTVVDGITFDSKKEAKRYVELRIMELARDIVNLKTQVKIPISIGDSLICTYIADFTYNVVTKKRNVTQSGQSVISEEYNALHPIIEDVKSEKTRKLPVYRIKKKLMKAIYDIDILET